MISAITKESRSEYQHGYAAGYEAGLQASVSERREYQKGYVVGFRAALTKIEEFAKDLHVRANGNGGSKRVWTNGVQRRVKHSEVLQRSG